MTIKKRLFLSNILMIVVPAVITALAGCLCLALVWLTVRSGGSMEMEDGEDVMRVGHSVVEQIQERMAEEPDVRRWQTDFLDTMTEPGVLRIVITQNGHLSYISGEEDPLDAQLERAADAMGETDTIITSGGRSLYLAQREYSGGTWSLYLFGSEQGHMDGGLKVVVALSAISLLFLVFLTILLTNRFLTRFVVRRIEEPLDLLSAGVRRIGEGDLDYRIDYAGKDEFAPVCQAFNDMAQRLKDSVDRTRRDEESRKELLAGISHDLRSPLTSIRAYVEGLRDGVPRTEEDRQRYLRTIHTKTLDIDRLVSQLFLYSKLDMDGVPTENRPIQLDRFVSELAAELEGDYRERGLALTLGELAPVTVSADPEQLRRVLTNIWDNSAKYKEREMGTVCIALSGDGRLTLSDDGPGVPEETLPKLFDAFYRSDPARKNPAGGSGLGLAIAAKAVRNMGGTIRAYDPPTGGLAVEITLRKEEDHRAEDPDR